MLQHCLNSTPLIKNPVFEYFPFVVQEIVLDFENKEYFKVEAGDADTYVCIAKNPAGSIQARFGLTIMGEYHFS